MQDAEKHTVLIVDDDAHNLTMLAALLKPLYKVRAATSGEKALRIASEADPPDLILLDVMMPGMDGYQTFKILRTEPASRDIPVIFVTALSEAEEELRGLELGAVDYLAKPIVPAIALARIRNQLDMKRVHDWLKDKNAFLETEIDRRMAENDLIQLVSVRALAHLAETRDPETGNHILRTQGYVQALARRLQEHPRFATILTDQYINLLTRSAPLHDIGKVGIPDAILLKPGKLNPDEWSIMKTHAKMGADAIELAERDAEQEVEFLKLAKEIAHWHHEKWDGSGYPDGLAGEAIPVSARLMALADVFDAIISARVYKAPISFDKARRIIAKGRGSHFDPDVADAFIAGFGDFTAIADTYRDKG